VFLKEKAMKNWFKVVLFSLVSLFFLMGFTHSEAADIKKTKIKGGVIRKYQEVDYFKIKVKHEWVVENHSDKLKIKLEVPDLQFSSEFFSQESVSQNTLQAYLEEKVIPQILFVEAYDTIKKTLTKEVVVVRMAYLLGARDMYLWVKPNLETVKEVKAFLDNRPKIEWKDSIQARKDMENRFVTNSQNVSYSIKDNLTGFLWHRSVFSGQYEVLKNKCNELGGLWRMPTAEEIRTLYTTEKLSSSNLHFSSLFDNQGDWQIVSGLEKGNLLFFDFKTEAQSNHFKMGSIEEYGNSLYLRCIYRP